MRFCIYIYIYMRGILYRIYDDNKILLTIISACTYLPFSHLFLLFYKHICIDIQCTYADSFVYRYIHQVTKAYLKHICINKLLVLSYLTML